MKPSGQLHSLGTDEPEAHQASAKVRAFVAILVAGIVVFAGAWFLDVAGGDLDTARILLNLPRNPGAGPRIGQPAPMGANEAVSTASSAHSAGSTGSTAPEGPAQERIVFTQVRSLSPP